MCVCVCVCVCVCLCVCSYYEKRSFVLYIPLLDATKIFFRLHINLRLNYLYVCVRDNVCLCVCVT